MKIFLLSNICFLLTFSAAAQKIVPEKGGKTMTPRDYISKQQNKTITEKEFRDNYFVADIAEILNQLDLGKPPVIIPQEYQNMNIAALPVKQLLRQRLILRDSIVSIQFDTLFPPDIKMQFTRELKSAYDIVNLKLLLYKRYTQCKQQAPNQPVEFYDGSLGVPKALVQERMGQVGQLQWLERFSGFDPRTDKVGKMQGLRWGSGCMIAKDLYLTAAHCVSSHQPNWEMPMKKNRPLPPAELCKLMRVQFNYEYDQRFPLNVNGEGRIRSDTCSYPILELVEYGPNEAGGYDYAILRLGKGADSSWPGIKFGVIPLCSNSELIENDPIFIIQHPDGMPKVIGGGTVNFLDETTINYSNINTNEGSSGSPVISCKSKKLTGIHFNGDCTGRIAANQAVRIDVIRQTSKCLQQLP
ncbi:trypsin-like serine peptidase [Chitinophaga flava]|uniref:Serine protease n=1 Tax=Chitinophaga flava TaxID=2259036 RepID=A0A365XSN3_9BACT|nr:serine protease [Chitinophaga flava]RBL89343.1 hypothetical protein DF182_22750 [Chitinophaga flava]